MYCIKKSIKYYHYHLYHIIVYIMVSKSFCLSFTPQSHTLCLYPWMFCLSFVVDIICMVKLFAHIDLYQPEMMSMSKFPIDVTSHWCFVRGHPWLRQSFYQWSLSVDIPIHRRWPLSIDVSAPFDGSMNKCHTTSLPDINNTDWRH